MLDASPRWRGISARPTFSRVCIGFGVLAVVAGSEAVSAKIPGALIGLVAATAAVIWAGLESKGVSVVGTVPATLPTPSFPVIAPEQWAQLAAAGFPDRHRRDGADGGDHALVSVRSR